MIDLIVKGLPELREKFREISKEVAQKVLKRGAAAGAGFLRDAIRDAAPISSKPHRRGRFIVPPGTLKAAAIEKFVKEESNATQASYIATFRRGKRYQPTGRDAYYAPWVERGHKVVSRKSKFGGRLKDRREASTKFVEGKFFMARAADANAQAAAQRMVDVMDKAIRTVEGVS